MKATPKRPIQQVRWFLLPCLGMLGPLLPAAEVQQVDVHHEAKQYRLHVVSRTEVPPEAVWALLVDYKHLDRLHPLVRESTLLESTPDGVARVSVQMHPCVFVFCLDLTQIVAFRAIATGHLVADFDQKGGDFRRGRLRWRLRSDPRGGTRLVFDAELEPSFWIPPLIGPWILKRALRNTATELVGNLERLSEAHRP